jgi:hypothetical protein
MEDILCIYCESDQMEVEVKTYYIFGKEIPAEAYVCQECGADYMDSEQMNYLRRMYNGD